MVAPQFVVNISWVENRCIHYHFLPEVLLWSYKTVSCLTSVHWNKIKFAMQSVQPWVSFPSPEVPCGLCSGLVRCVQPGQVCAAWGGKPPEMFASTEQIHGDNTVWTVDHHPSNHIIHLQNKINVGTYIHTHTHTHTHIYTHTHILGEIPVVFCLYS